MSFIQLDFCQTLVNDGRKLGRGFPCFETDLLLQYLSVLKESWLGSAKQAPSPEAPVKVFGGGEGVLLRD